MDLQRSTLRPAALLSSLLLSALASGASLESLPPGRWHRFPDSKLEAVAAKAELAGSVKAVMYAWSGGIYDTDRERLVVWGGGHNDYSGNEVYAFGPLTEATPKWTRLTEPSVPPAVNTPRGADGRPVSRHTYNLLTYLPAPYNKMMSCGIGSRHSDGYSDAAVDFFDFTVDGMSGQPWSAGPTAPSNSYAISAFCVYNPVTQQAWYQDIGSGKAQLQSYDAAKNRWSSHVAFNPDSEPTAAIDTRRNLLISTGNRNGTLLYDLDKPGRAPRELDTDGPKTVEQAKFPGFVYDALNDQFVGWAGGTEVYGLKVPANPRKGPWTWTLLAQDPDNEVVPTQLAGMRAPGYVTGTFGRFRYVPSLQGVVLVNATDEDVFFFRLPGGHASSAGQGATGQGAGHTPPGQSASLQEEGHTPQTSAAASTRPTGARAPVVEASLNAGHASFTVAVIPAPILISPGAAPGQSSQRTDNLLSLAVQSRTSSKQSGVPFTFGQVFKKGEIPLKAGLKAQLADGSTVPLQVDAKATHADGSLRHAVLSGRLDSLAGNATQALTLSIGPALEGTSLSLGALLASTYDTSVSLKVGGTTYTASAREALGGSNVRKWLSGPLVSEWIAGVPVKAAGGMTHPHLMAYFHVRAYAGLSQVRTDVVIENNWAFIANPDNFQYTANVSVPGKEPYVKPLTHYAAARWHKRFWWGSEPQLYVKHDPTYLQQTRAIPRYEALQPSESFLKSVRRSTEPMSNGDHSANMDETGYQPGIGPLPQWDAVYAVSADVRAFDYMLANADGGSAYGVHIRDEKTGLPITIDNHPKTSLADPEGSEPPLPRQDGSPYFEGQWSSHQPSIGYLPFLVSGDYFYLEEAQFWSAYNLIWPSVSTRNGNKGWWYTASLRGQAWAYRSLAQAAYITPDTHPLKKYFNDKLSSNIQRDLSLYVSPGGPHKNNLGAMFMAEGNDEYRFYDYFMSWAVQYLVDLGFEEAIPFRDYKVKFPIGLMGSGIDDYCFQAAPQYTWKVGPSGTATFYPDFRTVFVNTIPGVSPAACGSSVMTEFLSSKYNQPLKGRNAMMGDPTSATYWFAQLQPALAAAYDSGASGGKIAWERAQTTGAHPDFRNNPIWAVVPHTLTADGGEPRKRDRQRD